MFRVDWPAGPGWVLRAYGPGWALQSLYASGQSGAPAEWVVGRATLLASLGSAGYPAAPRLVPTRAGARAAQAGEWHVLVTEYVPGDLVAPTPGQLRALGGALGQLHALSAIKTAYAWYCLPGAYHLGLEHLRAAEPVPARWAGQAQAMREALEPAANWGDLAQGLIHGDAWAGNAVAAGPLGVVLVDWDTAGQGTLLLDLARLLLECHLDAEPRTGLIEPDAARIAAVVEGYRAFRQPPAADLDVLPAALRFTAAVVGAWWLAEAAQAGWPPDQVPRLARRLARVANRHAVSPAVAALAQAAFGSGAPMR